MDSQTHLSRKTKYFVPAGVFRAVCTLLLMAMIGSLSAASVPITGQELSGATGDPAITGSLWQLGLGLMVVLSAIAVSAWVLRRFGRVTSAVGGAIKVVGGVSMGPRERVVLLQVGDTQLLLGVTPGRIQSLHVLDQPVSYSDIGTEASSFAGRLMAAIKRNGSS